VEDIFCCVWDSLAWVCGSECVLCCGTVLCGYVGVSVCCVWESLAWFCGSECVLCVGQFVVGLWE